MPEWVELSFNWPQLWLSSCPLFCYISLIYSVQDRVRDRVPDCLRFPQRLIVVRQYVAHQRQNWLTHWGPGSWRAAFPSVLMLKVLVDKIRSDYWHFCPLTTMAPACQNIPATLSMSLANWIFRKGLKSFMHNYLPAANFLNLDL